MKKSAFFMLLFISSSLFSQQLALEKFGKEFTFLPEALDGTTGLPVIWLQTQHCGEFPSVDSTVSRAQWEMGDYELSNVNVFFSPVSAHNRWVLEGQWLTYEGYSKLYRNDFQASFSSGEHNVRLSIVNVKPQIYEPTWSRFTRWDARTQRLEWQMEKDVGRFTFDSFVEGRYSRFKPDRGNPLLNKKTRYAELLGEATLHGNIWSATLSGEWFESWIDTTHFRFSQINLSPQFNHPYGAIGFTLWTNNEEAFGYDGWLEFSKEGISVAVALESRFYPAIFITHFNTDTEADFYSARFCFEQSWRDWIHIHIAHEWQSRVNQSYILLYDPMTSSVSMESDDSPLLMRGEGKLEIGKERLKADLSWNYRDFDGLEYLWYHPGRINIQPGITTGTTLFDHLNLFLRLEALWQCHDVLESVWFLPELPGFVPVKNYSGKQESDWTFNAKITALVKTFTLSAGIDNILKKEIYPAQNIMSNSRMFVVNIDWLWYQ